MHFLSKAIVLFLILQIPLNVFAQDNTLAQIKAHYYAVAEMIENCSDTIEPEMCSIYKNEIILNSNGKRTQNWPAVGNYFEKITFWYDRAPAHWDIDDEQNGGEKALLKVTIENEYSVYSDFTEYLFKEGELVFCFHRQKGIAEYRFYFSEEKLIDFVEKKETNEADLRKEDSKLFLDEAENLKKRFLNMF